MYGDDIIVGRQVGLGGEFTRGIGIDGVGLFLFFMSQFGRHY